MITSLSSELASHQQSVLLELLAGASVGVAYGQSVGKVQSNRRDSEEWCSSAWSDASLCSVGPWWIFSFFFSLFLLLCLPSFHLVLWLVVFPFAMISFWEAVVID